MSTITALILLFVALAAIISAGVLIQSRSGSPSPEAETTPETDGVESELLRRPLRSRQTV